MTTPRPDDPAPVTGHPPSLVVTDVNKSYGPASVLRGVSFSLTRGHVHALAGGNGSGKSTLIKVLAGIERADGGVLGRPGRPEAELSGFTPARAWDAGLRFVHQDLGLLPDMTVAENVAFTRGFPRSGGGRIAWRRLHETTADLLGRFEVDVDPGALVRSLRPADRAMVAIARALADDSPDQVLVLDEPTASLPHHEVDILLGGLSRRARQGQTILYVSHRLDEVLSLADSVTVLRDGVVAATRGTRGLEQIHLAELMAGRSLGRLYGDGRRPDPAEARTSPSPPPVLQARGLTAGRISGVDLDVRAGEIVGLAGLLGSGRSTLLRTIFGAVRPTSGTLTLGGEVMTSPSVKAAMRRGVALVPEDRLADALFHETSVAQNMTIATLSRYMRWLRLSRSRERATAAGVIGDLRIKAAGPDQAVIRLSGGNQQKVVVARWLQRAPRVLLLDEPTQGVDVMTRADIYERVRAVAASGTSVIVASSDVEELAHLCDRVVVLRAGRVTAELSREEISVPEIVKYSYADKEAS
ncbi:sugar ABC transporter ATP-binding protein [Actinomadura graeca]|uniref:Sugar ABC transporter ATP-binding protein n=1 Tax=Actinomadura graeca TaxID=2750812 RepID=A0ABX8QWM6_9ACTN|nr:sugar ABC transporter ATP-binding protein [Actinomadura graeca]QXJ21173.1 sugar ABC transporter ATP-binding protein [Actinomadura graeca]